MRFSLTEGTTTPAITLGGGLVFLPTKNVTGVVAVYDSEESSGENPFDTDDGTTLATEWRFSYELGGLDGGTLLAFLYGFDRDYTVVGASPRAVLQDLLTGRGLKTKHETWAFYGNFSQYVQQWDDGRGWGVFARGSVADKHTSFVQWNVAAGLGGTGLFASRPKDTWGIGVYHLEFPDEGVLVSLLDIDDEQGFEAWYNFEITPWFHVTADLQVIDTAIGQPFADVPSFIVSKGGVLPTGAIATESDTAYLFALRMKIDF